VGKAANVADELSAKAIAGEAFKAAITGEPLQGRDVYRSVMTFRPQALHLFTTNTLPRFNGGLDRGLQRRLVVITFNRPIAEKDIIPDIADRIKRDELDLLLGFAISGAQRLRRNKGYTTPASSVEALRGWLLLDPVNEWFEARCVKAEEAPWDGWLNTGAFFADYKAWAEKEGHGERFQIAKNTFSQRLKAMPGVAIKRLHAGSFVAGITLSAVPL
jgi:phage/plasmid-associated DNA primase